MSVPFYLDQSTERVWTSSIKGVAIYDTILTFPKEVRCIWKRKFGAGTVLYLFIRYGTLFDMLLQFLNGFVTSRTAIVRVHHKFRFCNYWTFWQGYAGLSIHALTLFSHFPQLQSIGPNSNVCGCPLCCSVRWWVLEDYHIETIYLICACISSIRLPANMECVPTRLDPYFDSFWP